MTGTQQKTKVTLESRVEEGETFLSILFEPDDIISLRPMRAAEDTDEDSRKKVLYKECVSLPLREILSDGMLADHFKMLDDEKADGYFGVCPRQGSTDETTFELQWQIPCARFLWADIDYLRGKSLSDQRKEVQKRLTIAKLPEPTLVVCSGGGLHLYWKLRTPHPTGCDPRGVYTEFVEDDDGKWRRLKYIKDAAGTRIDLTDRTTFKKLSKHVPKLTEQADEIKRVLKQIATAVSGDHTTDLSRLLRLPGTYNLKNGGKARCRVVKKNLDSSVELSDFSHLPEASSSKEKKVSGVGRKIRSISPRPDLAGRSSQKLAGIAVYCDGTTKIKSEDKTALKERLSALPDIDDEDRSEDDFAFCCWAVRQGFAADFVFSQCENSSKFAERGEEYFEQTWAKAEESVASGDTAGPRVQVSFNEEQVNSEVLKNLAEHSDLYQQCGRLVEIIHHEGTVLINELNKDRLREIISNAMSFSKLEKEGAIKHIAVPSYCAMALLSRGAWKGIPQLNGVRYTPLMTSGGKIVQKAGYNQETGFYLHFDEQFPTIPESPRWTLGRNVLKRLESLAADFPFAAPAHKSAWLAALLTGFAGQLYEGVTAPLFLVDATQPGCGKTLLVDVISLILTGKTAARQAVPSTEDEFRKLITAKALGGAPLTLLDNVSGTLGCASLDAALTATEWTDRKLGQSETVTSQLETIWMATGNNIQLAGDLHRRVCHIRLESQTERPDQRGDFQHANLLDYVRHHRGQLVADCLTVLRAFTISEKRNREIEPWGSFEGWSSIIRSLLVCYRRPDPAETRNAVLADDEAKIALGSLLETLELCDPEHKGLTQNEIAQAAEGRTTGLESHAATLKEHLEALAGKGWLEINKSLGKRIGKHKGQIVGGRRLVYLSSGGRRSWAVERTS